MTTWAMMKEWSAWGKRHEKVSNKNSSPTHASDSLAGGPGAQPVPEDDPQGLQHAKSPTEAQQEAEAKKKAKHQQEEAFTEDEVEQMMALLEEATGTLGGSNRTELPDARTDAMLPRQSSILPASLRANQLVKISSGQRIASLLSLSSISLYVFASCCSSLYSDVAVSDDADRMLMSCALSDVNLYTRVLCYNIKGGSLLFLRYPSRRRRPCLQLHPVAS